MRALHITLPDDALLLSTRIARLSWSVNVHADMASEPRIAWLLDGDPSVAWQTERDLLRLPAARYERTRRRVAQSGWGARLLAKRAPDGTWGGGLYSPKWTSTFYTLQLLSMLGLGREQAECVQSCKLLLETGVTDSGAVRLWKAPASDTCVAGMLLVMSCRFGLQSDARVRRMLDWLLAEQMQDGGWNCHWQRTQPGKGASHASFHTTTSVLEGLQAWLDARPKRASRVERAAKAGREFMLVHQLYRSHRTGVIVRSAFTQPAFPYWWRYDVLRGLEHFQAADTWDARLIDPLQLIAAKCTRDGRWKLPRAHPGRVWFALEASGQPSRWNTLRALRVLAWAQQVRVQ